MWIIYTFAAVLAGIYGIVYLYSVWRLTQIRFRRSSLLFIDRDAAPEEERSKLAGAEEFLLGEGFAHDGIARVSPPPLDIPGPNEVYLDVYHHDESDVYAIVMYQALLARHCVIYLSCFSDGTSWHTYNKMRHSLPEFDNPCFFDDYLPDDAAAWPAHRKRVSDSGRRPARDKELAMRIIKEEETGQIDRMLEIGALRPAGEGRWRLTWLFAFRWMLNMQAGERKAKGAKTRLPSSVHADNAAERSHKRVEMEADAFFRNKEVLQGISPINRHKGKLFAVTAFLFLAAVAWFVDWTFSCVIFFVVLLHEAGHLTAMRSFGYSNTSVLFLPGLGALTAGEKRNASPFQRLIVYLAGPMPGILLSMILIYIVKEYSGLPSSHGNVTAYLFQSNWLVFFVVFSLFINYVNLLPVFPLDGGHVVGMLAFSRFPRVRFIFGLAGCLIFLLAAFLLRDKVSLAFALLLVLGIPAQWNLTRVRLAMGKHKETLTEEEAARRVFEALSHPRFAKWPLNRRFSMADVLITECM